MRPSRRAFQHSPRGSGSSSSSSGKTGGPAALAAPPAAARLFLAAAFVLASTLSPGGVAASDTAPAPSWTNTSVPLQRHARGRHHRLASSMHDTEFSHAADQSMVVWEARPMTSHLPLFISPMEGNLLAPRDLRARLRQEGERHNSSTSSCCPSVLEMVEPDAGKNQDGALVQLYRDERYRQRFYELSCHRDVLDKPCRFVDKRLAGRTKCVQQHGWTYALVRDSPERRHRHFPSFPANSEDERYTLDYISVRSGCSCVVATAEQRRKRGKHHKQGKNKG